VRLQALLKSDRLHLPRTREAGALTKELLTYELRVHRDGRERSGAFKVGTHDVLVCALGPATQLDPVNRTPAASSTTVPA
jgi:hypothetical protein